MIRAAPETQLSIGWPDPLDDAPQDAPRRPEVSRTWRPYTAQQMLQSRTSSLLPSADGTRLISPARPHW